MTSAQLRPLSVDLAALATDTAYKAAPVFRAAGWVWKVKDGKSVDPYVPGETEIAAMLKRMLGEAVERGTDGLSLCGRFRVSRKTESIHLVYEVDLMLGDYWMETSHVAS